jgi:broad specificity phosphatase PhoE
LGIQQALKANSFWKTGLVDAKIPAPESYYVSPLQRTLHTSNLTFTGLSLPAGREYKPVIKELLREALGVHTCDKRDTKSKITSLWPAYKFESNFPEQDGLWDPNYRESGGQQVHRLQLFLDDIFGTDTNIFVSCTSHSGSISSVQQGVGHRQFQLNTGAVIPIFLKAQRQKGPRPEGKIDPPVKSPTCPRPSGT